MFSFSKSLFALLAVTSMGPPFFSGVHAQNCPPPQLGTVPDFDFESFISAPFFVVSGILDFAVSDQLFFCARQAYRLAERQSLPGICSFLPFLCLDSFEGQVFFDIQNSGNAGSTSGPGFAAELNGITSSAAGNAEARIGPSFSPVSRLYTPLLVVAAGTFADLLDESIDVSQLAIPTSNNYEWAIFTNGPATRRSGNGCVPELQGLLLYSRDPLPGDAIISRIEDVTLFLGLDTTRLSRIDQVGCVYPPFE